jgi:phosphoesterase RecJ-like protein
MAIKFADQDVSALKQLLSSPRNIVITTHHRPDGDAIGSSLGLYHYLKVGEHNVNVIVTSDFPDFLHWMNGVDSIIDFSKKKAEAVRITSEADLIFCLDFNQLNRLDKYEEFVKKSSAKKILIDHHLDPDTIFDYSFSFPEACSTCELIYIFIEAMGDEAKVNKAIAECIYTGIMTDTNSFRYESMRASTHRIIASLIEAGVQNYRIHENVYDSFSIDRLRLLGYCICEKLTLLPEYRTGYMALSREELKRFNYKTGDTEGIVNYALSVKGIKMAALFMERDGEIKISFRSKDEFSVKEVSAKYFEGGGHRNAAGGRSSESLEKTVERFVSVLPLYKAELLKP